ncbi:hypothetical protein [Sphingomonas profundi]|uniref:hypothetical protein n=1 Tax=Alterirhizorhabdus profundi TaxID=2681549 RepID=UPI0012E76304|nr:hypothetical protein [Sphingomonas profundi]
MDRPSVYGLLLKPFVTVAPGLAGLWLAVTAQALAVAAALLAATRALVGRDVPPARLLLASVPVVLLTALPWHAGQFMPDALTGPLVLLACLAATRAPGAPGVPLLWLAILVLATVHYTHIVLLAAVALSAVAAQIPLGLAWRAALARAAAAIVACLAAAALLVAGNALVLSRPALSPVGAFFLFARLHEDGLIDRWLDRHCGTDAPAPLCADRARMPHDSQALLWGGANSPVATRIWQQRDDGLRWRWIDMMAAANRGAVAEQPIAFLLSSARGAARQFVTFRAIDDECPAGCGRNLSGGIGLILARDRPAALPALLASAQYRDTTPKRLVRAITTPVAALALLLLPLAAMRAWRRPDASALAFCGGIAAALVANAALAGALSDVHDRYQSRIVWLAPWLILLLLLRWRRPATERAPCPPLATGA